MRGINTTGLPIDPTTKPAEFNFSAAVFQQIISSKKFLVKSTRVFQFLYNGSPGQFTRFQCLNFLRPDSDNLGAEIHPDTMNSFQGWTVFYDTSPIIGISSARVIAEIHLTTNDDASGPRSIPSLPVPGIHLILSLAGKFHYANLVSTPPFTLSHSSLAPHAQQKERL